MRRWKPYSVEVLSERAEHWKSNQTKKRWTKYKDDHHLIEEKNAHQQAYYEDLCSFINENNASCDPQDRLYVSDWYLRWIYPETGGRYFVIQAMIRKGKNGTCRAYVGETNVFQFRYRKEELLNWLRVITNVLFKMASSINDILNDAIETIKKLSDKNREEINHTAQKNGFLDSFDQLVSLISALVSWTNTLDTHKNPPEETGKEHWLEVFLMDKCDLVKFYRDYCSDAFGGVLGRIGHAF